MYQFRSIVLWYSTLTDNLITVAEEGCLLLEINRITPKANYGIEKKLWVGDEGSALQDYCGESYAEIIGFQASKLSIESGSACEFIFCQIFIFKLEILLGAAEDLLPFHTSLGIKNQFTSSLLVILPLWIMCFIFGTFSP